MKMHGDYIMLEELIPEQRSRGGIHLVTQVGGRDEDATATPRFGRVLSYGPGGWDMSGTQRIVPAERVAVEDIVLLSKVGDYSYQWNGEKRLITKTANVIATLEEEEARGLGFADKRQAH